ncbi:hypothetical protein ACFXTO_041314 [Malus domestica]
MVVAVVMVVDNLMNGLFIIVNNKVFSIPFLAFGVIFATLQVIMFLLALITHHFSLQAIMFFHLVRLKILLGTLIREPLIT